MRRKLHQHLDTTALLPRGSKLVVAVSGGVDSMVLLDLINELNQYWGWNVTVAHLDHNIRGDSGDDAKLVGRTSQNYGYSFYLNQLTNPILSEAALRRARYDYLESVRAGLRADYIVTAHHADDKIETSVLNAIRGADRYGLTALKPVSNQVVRPLLPFTKGELITYAALHDIAYNTDPTNADVKYSRNFVRHNLIPTATTYEPDFRENYLNNLNQLEDLSEHIDWQLNVLLGRLLVERTDEMVTVDRSAFIDLPTTVQQSLLSYIARQLNGGIGLSQRNLATALNFANVAQTGTLSNSLPHLNLERNYGNLTIALKDRYSAPELPTRLLSPDSYQAVGRYKIALQKKPQPTEWANYLVKPSTLYIRGWQAGDRIAPIGMNGHRKLQDIFIDKKVPRSLRSRWPVVVDEQNHPVWVVGLCFDRNALAHPATPHYQLTAFEA